MSIYQEKAPAKTWWILHLLLFVALYLPNLGVRELRPDEALNASMAWEMSRTGRFFETRLHGEPVRAFPLDAWLISIASGFGRPTEWSARLPSVLAILGIAGISGYVAARAAGRLAGAVAAVMVLTSPVAMAESERAGGNAVFAFLLTAAWFSWYRLGRVEKRWNLAWFASLALVCLAAFDAGILAFLYFYLPLLFLRRPFRFAVRARRPAHAVGLGMCAAVLVAWHAASPGQVFFPWKTVVHRMMPESSAGYAGDLLWFPFSVGLYLFPWTFFVWPGFCAAFRPLETTPVFCRYLRTLILPVFAVGWLLPEVSPRSLLPVLGPLSVLTGIHYALLVRRHHRILARLPQVLGGAAVVAGGSVLAAIVLHAAGVVRFMGIPVRHVVVSACLAGAAIGLVRGLNSRLNGAWLWLRLVVAVLAVRLVFLAVAPPLHAAWHGRRRVFGRQLAESLPPEVTVYRIAPYLLPAECYYLDRPVVRIHNLDDVPLSERRGTLYVLAGDQYPLLDIETRRWEPCSPPVNLDSRVRVHVDWGRGPGGGLLRFEPQIESPAKPDRNDIIRMYRGVLRPPEDRLPAPPARPAGAGDAGMRNASQPDAPGP